jgi:ubiquinone/menaquinone biosynthesis C-methylase UbiE
MIKKMIKGRLEFALDYIPECSRLLDIGCDYGDYTASFLAKAREVYAVDPNEKVLMQARKNHKKIIFKAASAEMLPFKDSFFDVVVLLDVLEHVSSEKRAIDEIFRVLKPGGALVFSVPHKGLFRVIDAFNMKFYFPAIYRWFKGSSYNKKIYKEAPWHRHYSLNELIRFFGSRFEIEKIHRGGLFIWPLFWLIDASIYWKLFKKKPLLLDKAHNLISDIDYSISYGPFAYHLIMRLRSLKK